MRPRVVRIEVAERRLQPAAGDARLGVQTRHVEDADAGRFAAGAGGRRNRHQRLQRSGDRAGPCRSAGSRSRESRPADTSCRGSRPWRCRSSIRRRRRRTRRSADSPRERDGVEKRRIVRLDAHAVVERRRRRRSASSDSSTVRTGGRRLTTGSVTTSTRRAPRSARSMPTSRVTPAPKRTGDAAISNAVSRLMSSYMTATRAGRRRSQRYRTPPRGDTRPGAHRSRRGLRSERPEPGEPALAAWGDYRNRGEGRARRPALTADSISFRTAKPASMAARVSNGLAVSSHAALRVEQEEAGGVHQRAILQHLDRVLQLVTDRRHEIARFLAQVDQNPKDPVTPPPASRASSDTPGRRVRRPPGST